MSDTLKGLQAEIGRLKKENEELKRVQDLDALFAASVDACKAAWLRLRDARSNAHG